MLDLTINPELFIINVAIYDKEIITNNNNKIIIILKKNLCIILVTLITSNHLLVEKCKWSYLYKLIHIYMYIINFKTLCQLKN